MPQARRGRGTSSRSARGSAARRWSGWSPSTTRAPPRSAPRRAWRRRSSRSCGARRCARSRRRATRAAALYSNQEALDHYTAALGLDGRARPGRRAARIGEKQGDVALRLGRVDAAVEVWERCLELSPRRGGPGAGRGPAPQDRRRPVAQGRAPRPRSTTTSGGSTCSRTARRAWSSSASTRRPPRCTCTPATTCSPSTPPRRRCGSRSGSTRRRAASRAHGIFGRVFGRIGDAEKARENLERSVELARDSDRGEAVRALLTLGYHLEVSEADYEGAADAYTRGARARASEVGDLPSQVELHAALAQLAAYRAEWEEVERADRGQRLAGRARGAAREAVLPLPDAGRRSPGATATGRRRPSAAAAPTSSASRSGAPRSRSRRCFWLASALRDSGDHGGRRDRARPGARRLRAGRPDRAVDRGDRGARGRTWRWRAAPSRPRAAAEEAERLAERLALSGRRAPPPPRRAAAGARGRERARGALERRAGCWGRAAGRPLDGGALPLLRPEEQGRGRERPAS